MHPLPLLHQHQQSSPHNATPIRMLALRNEGLCEHMDWLATEEPLEMRVQGPDQEMVRVAVTMRTPGHDSELVTPGKDSSAMPDTPQSTCPADVSVWRPPR